LSSSNTEEPKPLKAYTFRFRGAYAGESSRVFAETRSKARYKLWLGVRDVNDMSFRDFQRICT